MTARRALAPAVLLLAAVAGCHSGATTYRPDDFTSDPPPPGPLRGTIVTSNSGDDTLSVVDPAGAPSGTPPLWQIPVGFIPVELEGPHHVVADPAGAFLFLNLSEAVAGSGGGPHGAHGTGTLPGYVLKLSTVDGSRVANVQVDPNPGDAALSADGATLYVSHYDLALWAHAVHFGFRQVDSNVAVIDTASMAIKRRIPICPAAHGIRLSADGATLFASCGPDEIAVVDLASLQVTRPLLPGEVEDLGCNQCPYAVAVAPDATVWVSTLGRGSGTSGGGSVRIYDPRGASPPGFDPARSAKLCGRAMFAAFGPDPQATADAPSYLTYVPEQGPCGDWLRIFRPGGTGQAPVPAGDIALPHDRCVNAHAVLIAPDQRTAWVVCEGDHVGPGSMVTVDLGTAAVVASTPLGVFPDGLVLVP